MSYYGTAVAYDIYMIYHLRWHGMLMCRLKVPAARRPKLIPRIERRQALANLPVRGGNHAGHGESLSG